MRRSARFAAFTLVELLVVVGIIALLVAILLPVLGGAMVSARQVTCQSNFRQLLAGHTQYALDNDGWMSPVYRRQPSGFSFRGQVRNDAWVPWYSAIYVGKYVNQENVCSTAFAGSQQLPSNEIVYCPERRVEARHLGTSQVHRLDIGIGYNNSRQSRFTSLRVPQFQESSRLIVLVDSTTMLKNGLNISWDRYFLGQTGMVTGNDQSNTGFPAYRHGSEANVGFMDGHVESVYATDPADPKDGLAAVWKDGKVTHRAAR